MVRCKKCGGTCKSIGNGEYQCVFCGSVFSDETPRSERPVAVSENSGADVFEKSVGAILEISCVGKKSSWVGSGYIISNRGYAVTNAHVAADDVDGSPCNKMTVRVCGSSVPATVVALADNKAGYGNGTDLAIIKLSRVPAGAVALGFENSDSVRNGERVYVIGNSLGEGICITSGIISDKNRQVDGKKFIMTDCAVNGGNSGGPLFDEKGKVIGTITLQGRTHSGTDAEGMNYAIPSNTVKDFVDKTAKRLGIIF